MTVPDHRRIAVAVAAGAVPWILVPYPTGASLVFSIGLVTPTPFAFQSVLTYATGITGGIPPSILAWPVATLLYLLALASLGLSVVDREDRRVTAGLFVLAGLDLCYFAVSFSSARLQVIAIPLGVPLLWLAAWASRPDGPGVQTGQ